MSHLPTNSVNGFNTSTTNRGDVVHRTLCCGRLRISSYQSSNWSLSVKLKVLFLCASNGVQSPMAEALLNRVDSTHFEAVSAGLDRGENHPLTVEVMQEIGVDLKGRAAKTTHDLLGRGFDFV